MSHKSLLLMQYIPPSGRKHSNKHTYTQNTTTVTLTAYACQELIYIPLQLWPSTWGHRECEGFPSSGNQR